MYRQRGNVAGVPPADKDNTERDGVIVGTGVLRCVSIAARQCLLIACDCHSRVTEL